MTNSIDRFAKVNEHYRQISLLRSSSGLLGWDMETIMPNKAARQREAQLSALAKQAHHLLCDLSFQSDVGKLLDKSEKLSSFQKAELREVQREIEQAVKVEESLVVKLSSLTARAQHVWTECRQQKDYKNYWPLFEDLVELKHEQARQLEPEGEAYNAHLDLFEPGLTVEQLDKVFGDMKSPLIDLVAKIKNSTVFQKEALQFPEIITSEQHQFCKDILARHGFDFEAGRLDISAHPFCSGAGSRDVRMTTRFDEADFSSALYGAIHEGGHGLYEQGINEELYATPLGEAVSLGIHESQSRIWENQVARSRPYMQFLLGELRDRWPMDFRDIDSEALYKRLNRVEPSFIRVEADEVTYSLHVILRYEIERDLFRQKISAKEIPELWNQKMKDFLGIVPENDENGWAQDVHWSAGLFGYFPTYVLGNLYSAHFFDKCKTEIKSLDTKIATGEFAPFRAWLKQNVHRYGREFSASDLLDKVCSCILDSQVFIDYLNTKYKSIYKI